LFVISITIKAGVSTPKADQKRESGVTLPRPLNIGEKLSLSNKKRESGVTLLRPLNIGEKQNLSTYPAEANFKEDQMENVDLQSSGFPGNDSLQVSRLKNLVSGNRQGRSCPENDGNTYQFKMCHENSRWYWCDSVCRRSCKEGEDGCRNGHSCRVNLGSCYTSFSCKDAALLSCYYAHRPFKYDRKKGQWYDLTSKRYFGCGYAWYPSSPWKSCTYGVDHGCDKRGWCGVRRAGWCSFDRFCRVATELPCSW